MKTKMVVDTANLLFRVAAVNDRYNFSSSEQEKAGLAMHMTLNTLNKFYKMVLPSEIALVFEGHNNWRKQYTISKQCISGKIYKANRIKTPKMQSFFALMDAFQSMVKDHTSLICLQHEQCEGDDMVAAYCEYNKEDKIYIVSGDSDFNQLLKYVNVDILKPNEIKTFRQNNLDFDPNFFIFEKCFRGDKKDNVFPAYPRLIKTKIIKAYTDEYYRNQIFNTEMEILGNDGNMKILTVGDLWNENKLLLDLQCQPDDIKQIMLDTVKQRSEQRGKFNLFYFQKFLGKYNLEKISDNISQYVDMFNISNRNITKQRSVTTNKNIFF